MLYLLVYHQHLLVNEIGPPHNALPNKCRRTCGEPFANKQ